MKYVRLILFIFIFTIFAKTNSNAEAVKKQENLPHSMIITSDLHLSLPEGRWPDNTKRFLNFMESVVKKQKPEIIFIVGDIIDNVIINNGRAMAGCYKYPEYFKRETALYKSITKRYSPIQFMESLGPGHDFSSKNPLKEAEKNIGNAKGVSKWQGTDFIWFTIAKTFKNGDPKVLSVNDYAWLDEKLNKAAKAVLLFHVPLRTETTYVAGKWSNGSNLTISTSDKLYNIIDKYSNKILAIFNGHIHTQITSSYKGIPVYLCPFVEAMSYLVVTVKQNPAAINVEVKKFHEKQ